MRHHGPCTAWIGQWDLTRLHLALGSFVKEYNNKVQIDSLDEEVSEFNAEYIWSPISSHKDYVDTWQISFIFV